MGITLSLANQVVVVTGGAGGIGSVIARRLAEAEARVIITDLNGERAQETAAGLPGAGHWGVSVAVDDSAGLKGLADQIAERYGRLDVLVNCAGITRPVAHDDLDGLDDELIDAIFRVNWRGSFACVRAFRGLLAAPRADGERGLVINISSIAGTTGIGSNVAYCASKAAVNAMTLSLARALAPAIRVVAVAPGWVEGEYAKRMDPAILEVQRQKTPLARLAQAEDVAEAILAVATSLKFSTGCIIPVDGGRPLN
ncbi:MAG: SDR family oxidoreductase [Anaerolineales bacterium]|nr:SDR family oxidoreductase [Anaerolineales bacterium]